MRTLHTYGPVAGRSRVRESVRYITHDSCAISVVPTFNSSELFQIVNHDIAEKVYTVIE